MKKKREKKKSLVYRIVLNILDMKKLNTFYIKKVLFLHRVKQSRTYKMRLLFPVLEHVYKYVAGNHTDITVTQTDCKPFSYVWE